MAQMTLDDLTGQLRQMHGGKLRCVLLYGSAAAGDQAAALRRPERARARGHDRAHAARGARPDCARLGRRPAIPTPLELTVRGVGAVGGHLPHGVRRHPRAASGAARQPAHRAVSRWSCRPAPPDGVRGHGQGAAAPAGHHARGQRPAGSSSELLRASHSTLMVVFRAVVRIAGEGAPQRSRRADRSGGGADRHRCGTLPAGAWHGARQRGRVRRGGGAAALRHASRAWSALHSGWTRIDRPSVPGRQ